MNCIQLTKKFLSSYESGGLRLPLALFKLAVSRSVTYSIDDQLLNQVLEAGFDPVYGARPLKRAIQQLIENPLAEDILSGKFSPGVTIKGTLDKDIAVFFGD